MKDNKIFLDIEEEEISIGLLRLSQKIQDYELFFNINLLNSFKFSREKDFILKKEGACICLYSIKLMMKLLNVHTLL